jgi:hypothetical protein
MERSWVIFILLFALQAGCAAQSSSGPVDFQPGSDVRGRIQSPSPGRGATEQSKRATIGRGKTAMDTGDAKDTFWNEPIDLEGAGSVVRADMLWDASGRILYMFARSNLRCTHGKSVEGDVLIGIYGKKNFLDKSPGSGWWVVNLGKDECEAPVAGLYGCKFDPRGNILACGRAELDARINDMAIVEATSF